MEKKNKRPEHPQYWVNVFPSHSLHSTTWYSQWCSAPFNATSDLEVPSVDDANPDCPWKRCGLRMTMYEALDEAAKAIQEHRNQVAEAIAAYDEDESSTET